MLTVANLVVDRPPHRFHYDFVVPTGGALIIKGPSGEGKSTLLDALGGFLTIAAGEVTWDGQRWANVGTVDMAVLNGNKPFSIILKRKSVRSFSFRTKSLDGTKDVPAIQNVWLRQF